MKTPMRNALPMLALAAGLTLMAGAAIAADTVLHPFLAAQPKQAPEEANLAVEIPAGSFTKYEIKQDGLLHVDRFQSMPVAYPANYGSMPRTLAGDNDPLDALVLTREPLHPGVIVGFRPIGYLKMVDDGEQDEKVIGVPTDKVDPSYAHVRDLDDLAPIERQRIEAFFRVYKDLPEGRNPVQLSGWGNAAEAKVLIQQSMQRFDAAQPAPTPSALQPGHAPSL